MLFRSNHGDTGVASAALGDHHRHGDLRILRRGIGDVYKRQVYCLVRTVWPEGIRLLPLYVFLFAAGVEGSQYFHLAAVLGADRMPFLGVLLGGTFDWADLVCYGVGCLLLWMWQKRGLERHCQGL